MKNHASLSQPGLPVSLEAQLHWAGTINDSGSYALIRTVTDSSPDTARMQIWDGSLVIYDNQTSPLSTGQLSIHN